MRYVLDSNVALKCFLPEEQSDLARALLSRFLSEASAVVVPFGESHYSAALDAWLRFGKGRHTAALNFGDCLSYAVARLAGEPPLYVGEDFGLTDVARARGSVP